MDKPYKADIVKVRGGKVVYHAIIRVMPPVTPKPQTTKKGCRNRTPTGG
jgi:hypothetical protein